jgi:hypothetical protein
LASLLADAPLGLSANEFSEKIIAATEEFTGPGNFPADDRTLLVLRVTGEGTADYSKLPVIY